MSVDLWVSVALAIPLAIIANLATPKLQKWLDERSSIGKERKAEEEQKKKIIPLEQLKAELKGIEELIANPAKLINQNLTALLKIALYSAFGTLYGSMFVLLGEVGQWDGISGILGRIGAQITALFVAMLVFYIAMKAIRTNNRVNKYEQYKEQTENLIKKLEINS